MARLIRRSDLALLAAGASGLAAIVPTEVVTNSQPFQRLITAMPNGVAWFFAGFFVALWAFYPWGEHSRVLGIWNWLTRKFVVQNVHVGRWTDDFVEMMPQSDCGVRVMLKFRKTLRPARLRLRVIEMTGMHCKPRETVIDLGREEIVRGEVLSIPIVTAGSPSPGWDHIRPRGWGPCPKSSIIGGAPNIAIIECEGRWTTQRHSFFIQMIANESEKPAPHIFVLDEAHHPFDVDEPIGRWAYDR